MFNWSLLLTFLIYLLLTLALFLFGLNILYLTAVSYRRQPDKATPPPPATWPAVTVQLPIYNEWYVVERLITAVTHLDYPHDRLHIQLLDDSTDETSTLVAAAVARAQAQGISIVHLQRENRTGFKAGALQAGLVQARGEYIAMFDADFVPPSDFLKRALPALLADPKAAFVQTRWGHLNRNYSFLTLLQSLAIDGHFMVEQYARSQSNFWFNFNGTAGIWRRAALDDAGGWRADTLTEDLDLSYRAYLRGWHGRFLRDVVVPAELPVSFSAFRRQQHRWAHGSLDCARRLLPKVWQAPQPLHIKLQATMHLLGYAVHLLLFLLTLLYPVVGHLAQQYSQLSVLYGLAYLFGLVSLAPTLFFIAGQAQQGRPIWPQLPKILFVTVAGSGMMLNTVRAALQLLWRRPAIFQRTAKFGVAQRQHNWMRQRYQLRLDKIIIFELALGLFNLWTAWLAVGWYSWGIAGYALLYGTGLLFVASLSIWQAAAVYRQQRQQAQRWSGTTLTGAAEPN